MTRNTDRTYGLADSVNFTVALLFCCPQRGGPAGGGSGCLRRETAEAGATAQAVDLRVPWESAVVLTVGDRTRRGWVDGVRGPVSCPGPLMAEILSRSGTLYGSGWEKTPGGNQTRPYIVSKGNELC
ncbi:hypothetical protein GCM10010517_32780 [Streptosporangium fragile]|uniref:Uncharacterized protein n=1 Tax=Streptosporangium fragile TaxID=46186 RepID=A0ABP6IDA8_9ACTN